MSILRNYLDETATLETFTVAEIEAIRNSLDSESDPGLKRQLREELIKVYKDGLVEAEPGVNWAEFNAQHSNDLTLKRYYYNWLAREDLDHLREIQRFYEVVPKFWESPAEPPGLAIIGFVDSTGKLGYTSPVPSLSGGGPNWENVVFWTSEKGYRSGKSGVHQIRKFSDYSLDERRTLERHVSLDLAMMAHLKKVIYPRFPLGADVPIDIASHLPIPLIVHF